MGLYLLHLEMQVTTWLAHMGNGHVLFLMQGEPLMSVGEPGTQAWQGVLYVCGTHTQAQGSLEAWAQSCLSSTLVL